jgi:UDP-glucose 4-epimerase
MKVLVTGGAGYIGSHTCVELLNAGHEIFVIDNLCNGHEEALKRVRSITHNELQFMNADIREANALDEIFNTFKPEAVIHFAGLKAVGESVSKPLIYYDVNVGGSISLLNSMSRAKCHNIVFSSSATVYGNPKYLPYDESHPTCPTSPYGRTKAVIENIINDWTKINKKNNAVVLRYFNPVGAHISGQIGEQPQGVPNNLMPFIAQVATGQRDFLSIYGDDYKTRDGTCLRDYIHVSDLADAHIKAIDFIGRKENFEIFNIGSGKGTSVLELIKGFEKATKAPVNFKFAARRNGDLPEFWADTSKARKLLGWEGKIEIDQMCEDCWRWQMNNLAGYN